MGRAVWAPLGLALWLLAAGGPAWAQGDVEVNKALVRDFYKAIVSNDQGALPHFFAQGYQVVDVVPPSAEGGARRPALQPDFRERAEYLHRALKDIALSITDLVAEGDQVAALVTMSGTQKGEFMGVAPTGRRVSINAFVIFEIRDGRIQKTTELVDLLGTMRQLGYLKLD